MSVNWPKTLIDELYHDHSREPWGGLATFGVLRLALPTGSIAISATDQHSVKVNPTVFHRLRTGDVNSAIDLAARQLSAAGMRPRVKLAVGSSRYAERLAAAMLFGLSDNTYSSLARGLIGYEALKT
jgi:CRISPR-associated protein Csx17